MSYEINMHRDRIFWNRQTYSLLDYLGDLGGLTDALMFICRAIIGSYSTFSLQVALTEKFVKVRKHGNKDQCKDADKSQESLVDNLSNFKKLPEPNYFVLTCLNCCCLRDKVKR